MAAAFPLQAVKLKRRTGKKRKNRKIASDRDCMAETGESWAGGVAAQKKARQIRFVYDTHAPNMPHILFCYIHIYLTQFVCVFRARRKTNANPWVIRSCVHVVVVIVLCCHIVGDTMRGIMTSQPEIEARRGQPTPPQSFWG